MHSSELGRRLVFVFVYRLRVKRRDGVNEGVLVKMCILSVYCGPFCLVETFHGALSRSWAPPFFLEH